MLKTTIDTFMIADSESDAAYTDTSDSDGAPDELYERALANYGGRARSILSGLDDTVVKMDDFLSFERGFAHGDVVAAVADPSGQLGRVVAIDVAADLEAVTSGNVVRSVKGRNLSRVRAFVAGDYAVMGPWVGRVVRAFDVVTVFFDDGTKDDVLVKDADTLRPISSSDGFEDDLAVPGLFYPGQRVRLDCPIMPQASRWLCGGSSGSGREQGTVCHVEVGLAQVNWIASVVSAAAAPPPQLQDPKNLILLSCFPHTSWQIGDYCALSSDARAEYYVIMKTKSSVDVLWQSGELSAGIAPSELIPVSSVGEHDFWPGQFVMEKAMPASDKRAGVVGLVDALEKTVRVRWIGSTALGEETVSAYELVDHPEFSYCIGEVVVRSTPAVDCKSDGVDQDQDAVDLRRFLGCVGYVVGQRHGDIEVKWANNVTTMVRPSEITGLERLVENLATTVIGSESSTDTSVTLLADDQQVSPQAHKGLDHDLTIGCTLMAWPKAAFDFLARVASGLLGTHDRQVQRDSQYQLVKPEMLHAAADDVPLRSFILEQEPEQADCAGADNTENSPPEKFKQFDVTSDCADHHFVQENGGENQVKRGWLKRIQREWNILKCNMPGNIYVRVYEERMDLMRACIVGAAGTPYHDALFFFDIFLPADYPHDPPLVHYHSGGLRLNPNLYESGKVCLSLLNTWTGTGTEVWAPDNSSVLQVLLSLQALVLNDKPYFNEAGYDKQLGRADGEKNSVAYNENAFLLSCKSMLYLLQKPPKHFEKLVEEHFAARGTHILDACRAYMEGAIIGHPQEYTAAGNDNGSKGCSTGFKIMMTKLLPKLASAFSELGVDCAQFAEKLPAGGDEPEPAMNCVDTV